jgi:hypothetical protein
VRTRVGGNTFSKPCQGAVDFSPLSQESAVLLTRQQPSSEAFDGEPECASGVDPVDAGWRDSADKFGRDVSTACVDSPSAIPAHFVRGATGDAAGSRRGLLELFT